jgi:hypothetical protein
MLPDEQVSQLLGGLGDRAVALNSWFFEAVDVLRVGRQVGLTSEQIDESLAIYVEKRIVQVGRDETGSFTAGNLTDVGLDCYMQACRPTYPAEQTAVRRKLSEHLIRETPNLTSLTLVNELGHPRLVVDHVLRVFARHGLLKIMGPGPGNTGEVLIGSISPEIVAGGQLGYNV